MTFENVAWMVKGGLHSAAIGRMATFDAVDAEGVFGINDMRVVASSPASSTVRISTGGARLINRYPNQINEAYIGRNVGYENVTIAATGGTARSDLLVARIKDPEFDGGFVPADPKVGPYFIPQVIANVPSTTTDASKLNLGYPAVALARIDIPANTAAITQAMIVDVRKVPRPRRESWLFTHALVTSETDKLDLRTPVANERWPDRTFTVDVPTWATVAQVVGTWSGVLMPPGNTFGKVFVLLGYNDPGGDVRTQEVRYDSPGVSGNTRQVIRAADDVAIPAHLRGKTITVEMIGRNEGGTAAAAPVIDWGSSIDLAIEFREKAILT